MKSESEKRKEQEGLCSALLLIENMKFESEKRRFLQGTIIHWENEKWKWKKTRTGRLVQGACNNSCESEKRQEHEGLYRALLLIEKMKSESEKKTRTKLRWRALTWILRNEKWKWKKKGTGRLVQGAGSGWECCCKSRGSSKCCRATAAPLQTFSNSCFLILF